MIWMQMQTWETIQHYTWAQINVKEHRALVAVLHSVAIVVYLS
jgi:hypothetical protein